MAAISLDRIEVGAAGFIGVRLCKDPVPEDGAYHRFSLEPGVDAAAMFQRVNADLARYGYPAMSADDMAQIQDVCTETWTPEIVAAHRAASEFGG